jgi:hypothetical protein
MSALPHTVKWGTKKNELITEIKHFLELPHITKCDCSLKMFHHLTKHTDISESNARNVCRDVSFHDIYNTQEDTHCVTMDQWDSSLLSYSIASLIFNHNARWDWVASCLTQEGTVWASGWVSLKLILCTFGQDTIYYPGHNSNPRPFSQ